MAGENKQEKKFKKGEFICREGDQPKSFFIIQAGKVSIYVERGGQRIEIDQAGPGQIICEQGIFGFPRQAYTCEAISEVKCVELPIEPIKMVFEKSPLPLKTFMKAMGEEIRKDRNQLRTLKSDMDNAPCPPRFIPRLCAILSLVAKNAGKTQKVDPNLPAYKKEELANANPKFKETDLILSFNTLKIYTSRMFFETHQRMQSFCELLEKLGYLTCIYQKNEDTGQDELTEVRLHEIEPIEMFGEFYQHNFFKPGRSEVIHIDKFAYQLARALVEFSKQAEVDSRGFVSLEYQKLLEDIKEVFGLDVKESHIHVLEKKGLFVKRSPINDKVFISFDKTEFHQIYSYWQIINEIDHWNEKGFVDKKTDYNAITKEAPKNSCPNCKAEVAMESNFCPQCGHKLLQAA